MILQSYIPLKYYLVVLKAEVKVQVIPQNKRTSIFLGIRKISLRASRR